MLKLATNSWHAANSIQCSTVQLPVLAFSAAKRISFRSAELTVRTNKIPGIRIGQGVADASIFYFLVPATFPIPESEQLYFIYLFWPIADTDANVLFFNKPAENIKSLLYFCSFSLVMMVHRQTKNLNISACHIDKNYHFRPILYIYHLIPMTCRHYGASLFGTEVHGVQNCNDLLTSMVQQLFLLYIYGLG